MIHFKYILQGLFIEMTIVLLEDHIRLRIGVLVDFHMHTRNYNKQQVRKV